MTETSLIADKITSGEQLGALLKEKTDLFLLLFYSPNSQKSLDSLGALENLKKNNDELNLYTVDVSEVRDVHPVFNITTVPTLVVFRNGKQAEFINGVQTEGFYAQLLRKRTRSQGDANQQYHRVTVYTTTTCPYCTAVKQYLDDKNIFYDEVDVAADPSAAQELVNRTGQQGVPQTEIDGSFVIGFNTKELDRLLEQ